MVVHEVFEVPADCRVILDGVGERTARDVAYPRSWKGLAIEERRLLEKWVEGLGGRLQCLHTDVPVGMVPDVGGREESAIARRFVAEAYPLRIDAVVCLDGEYLVCELKQGAGYVALGQVLTYTFYAVRTCAALRDAAPCVVTDEVQRGLVPVYSHYGVRVVEVGYVDD